MSSGINKPGLPIATYLSSGVDWLSDQSREDLYSVYRYPGQLLLSPEQSGIKIPKSQPVMDLRDYSARRGAGSSVLYCHGGTFTADFSDMGKRIVLNRCRLTEESVSAALQLANQKWGATEITGNAEYKELCISAAVKYGLKLGRVHIKRASNIIASIITEIKFTSSLS